MQLNTNYMRYILSNLIFIFIIASLAQCSSPEKEINKKLNEMASNLNEYTPVMLDQYTRFNEATVSSDNIFTYHYTVLNTENPDSLICEVESVLKTNIKNEISTNPELAYFKQNNVVLEYVYNDDNNQTIRLIRVNPEDYQ